MPLPRLLPDQMSAIDTPADNEVLTYDSATGKFEWVDDGGAAALDDLSDVTLTAVAQNDFFVRGVTDWNNVTPAQVKTILNLQGELTQSQFLLMGA